MAAGHARPHSRTLLTALLVGVIGVLASADVLRKNRWLR
jgi:hypothetical protein